MSSYLHYDVFGERYANFGAMMGITNEPLKDFASEMRKCGILHGTDPSTSFPRLEASLYDDCKSSFTLGLNLIDDTPSTDQEEASHPSLTSSSLVP